MPKRRRDPISEHASLRQAGAVQARLARRPMPFVPAMMVLTRNFDDGRNVGTDGTAATVGEYDVCAANPRFNSQGHASNGASMPLTVMPQAGNGHTNGHFGDNCDVMTANPGFDPRPYQADPDATPDRVAEIPAAAPIQASPGPSNGQSPATHQPSAQGAAGSDTQQSRQPNNADPVKPVLAQDMRKLVDDDDFRNDLDAILNGAAEAVSQKGRQSRSRTAQRNSAVPSAQSNRSSHGEGAAALSESTGDHKIFDEIAEKMRYATAYELAPVSLSRRFDSFDRQGPRRSPPARGMGQKPPMNGAAEQPVPATHRNRATTSAVESPSANPPADSNESAHADNAPPAAVAAPPVESASPPADQAKQTPAPHTLRPLTVEERVATYGDPLGDPDSWAVENVVTVHIPQLIGTPSGETVSDGNITFHRLGSDALADLFAAWEQAGVLDKVLTFDGTHTAGAPHAGGDTHLWAIAFDINTEWNPAGSEPAGPEEKGSVHELVTLADRHGFLWGGHDPLNSAGMHFELGRRA